MVVRTQLAIVVRQATVTGMIVNDRKTNKMLRSMPTGPTVHWSDSIKHQTPEIRFIICRRCLVHIDKIDIFVSKSVSGRVGKHQLLDLSYEKFLRFNLGGLWHTREENWRINRNISESGLNIQSIKN